VGVSCLTQATSAGAPIGRTGVRELYVDRPPIEVHSSAEGWGEYPSLAITDDFAYVAYDVREGNHSTLYLAKVSRDNPEWEHDKIAIEKGGDSEFAPQMELDGAGNIWIAWNSYGPEGWSIRACKVHDMSVTDEMVVAPREAFPSQVQIATHEDVVWFAWTRWDEGAYLVLARRLEDGDLGKVLTVYEGSNPVGRPDLLVLDDSRVHFVWDEYTGDRFGIRRRYLKGDELSGVIALDDTGYSNGWEPHIAGAEGDVIITWHRVPGGSPRCEPAAARLSGTVIPNSIDRPEDDETWRVRCFRDPEGANWIAWATRYRRRSTTLYLRKILSGALSKTCKVVFPIPRVYINWLDFHHDGQLVMTYEHSGSVYFCQIDIPPLGRVDTSPGNRDEGGEAGREFELRPPRELTYSTVYEGEVLNVYFGDTHNHTSFSDGRAYSDIAFILGRDGRGLDFMSITDHDGTLAPGEFSWTNEVGKNLSAAGDFTCIPAFEENKGWGKARFGHWSILFPAEAELVHYRDGMTPEDLFEAARVSGAVMIPHHVSIAWAPYNWDYFDPSVQPVVEMCSAHGIFETMEVNEDTLALAQGHFVRDALERGHRFGVIGSSDFHNCFAALSTEYGLAGVYARDISKASLFQGMRKRRTFAFSGGRVIIDFRCNGKFMGEEVHGSDILFFTGYVAANDPIESVEIISDGNVVYSHDVNGREFHLEWRTEAAQPESYFYLRMRTSAGDLAWSSPIWIVY
jgi:hypothetical protein